MAVGSDMNIMHIIPGDLWAGAEVQVYYTLRELNKQSFHKFIVVLFNKKELFYRLSRENLKSYVIDENKHGGHIICLKIKELIKEYNPDIIHVHEYKSHVLATFAKLLARNNCKIIRTLHGFTTIRFNIKFIKSYLISKLEEIFLNKYTASIVAVSRNVETILKAKYKRTHISQNNNAIEFPLAVNDNPEDVRVKFDVGSNTFWVGTTSRLVSVKNIQMLIEAAKILNKQNISNCKISIFGDGHLKDKLQQNINQYDLNGIVVMHGHHKDIVSIINAFDVFVLTSIHEGLPMSLLEAMAVGTVPVCTKVGGMPEVIEEKKSGFLVEPNDANGLAETLLSLYINPKLKDSISSNAKNRIKSNYSIGKSVKLLLSLYESV